MRLGEPRDRKREICPMQLPAVLIFGGGCWKSRSELGSAAATSRNAGGPRAAPCLLHAPRVRPDGAGSSRAAPLYDIPSPNNVKLCCSPAAFLDSDNVGNECSWELNAGIIARVAAGFAQPEKIYCSLNNTQVLIRPKQRASKSRLSIATRWLSRQQ